MKKNANTQTAAGKMSKAEAGRLGGLATVAAHGSMGMSAIGYGGMLITAERHFAGDVAGMMETLRERRKSRATFDEALGCWKLPAAAIN